MKNKVVNVVAMFIIAATLSGCATLYGGKISECQKTKPSRGEPKRTIRTAAFIADLFSPLSLIIDFATGAIYKPCEINYVDNNSQEVLDKLIVETKEAEKTITTAPITNNETPQNSINNTIEVEKTKEETSFSKQNETVSVITSDIVKISDSEENETSGIKYRRSSLYVMMINDNNRAYANVIQDAFEKSPLPEKFNNHNLNSKIINAKANAKDQLENISNHLSTNNIAKRLVARWFNRSEKGGFNMNLIAKRGNYNATEMDVNIAKNSQRGLAMLADAGEELIGNTFVVINDFKYVSKEEIANKTKKGLSIVGSVASFVPGGSTISKASKVASVGATVAGKGYIIKTTSYLYRLVWNPEVASVFYNNYWTEDATIDENKKQAFDNSNIFTLKYVGSEEAWADLQSTVFTSKSEEELIRIATVKAIDAGIAKLQRKFEEFRTKSPLYSGEPLSAKIGLKEGLEAGDKFEVLEQTMDNEGKTFYKKLGIIRVDDTQIWDNRYMAGEENPVNKNGYTLFKGERAYSSGMLIRQIN